MKWPDLRAGEWRRRGQLAYLRPIGWVLHRVLAEKSGTPGSFYVWRVVMPLAPPAEVVVLDWSDRLGDRTQTYVEGSVEADEALVTAAAQAQRFHQAGKVVVDPPGGADNVAMQEARAYGLVVTGESVSAAEVLTRVLRYPPSFDWERQMIRRAEGVKNLLDRSDLDGAISLIASWRAASLRALRLDE